MNGRPTIFVSPYRNVSIRYIIYSDIFKELLKQDIRIIVFVKDGDLEYYRDRLSSENVIVEPVFFDAALRNDRANRFIRMSVLARQFISGSAPGYKNSSDHIQVLNFHDAWSGTFVSRLHWYAIRLIATLANRSSKIRKALVALESKMAPGHLYDSYFERYKPQMLVVSSLGYMIDPQMMRAAKRHETRVVSIVHGWDNPTTKAYRGAEPDYAIAWNDTMRQEISVFHDIPDDRVHVGGVAHWDFYFNGSFKPGPRSDFLKRNGLSNDRSVIFYAMPGYVMYRHSFDIIERVLHAIESSEIKAPSQLLARFHPIYMLPNRNGEGQVIDKFRERIESIEQRFGHLIRFVEPAVTKLRDDVDQPVEDQHGLAESLYHSDVMLTEYSTTILEAAICDLPVVNISLYEFAGTDVSASLNNDFTHIKRILDTGALQTASTEAQVIEFINYYLEDRSRDRENRQKLVDSIVDHNRGVAGQDIGKYIYGLLR